ncbi:MAG: T9SS type A sorting domain-containing protein, partial [FCB group bacterium]|nr:T9SS type A sorting domain-containing protein [FCB group bacterium]
GTSNGGVFRSVNGGNSWEAINAGLPSKYIYVLIIDTNDDIYVGCLKGIYRSDNNGNSWQKVNSGVDWTQGISFARDSREFIYVGTSGLGVYRSAKSMFNNVFEQQGIVTSFILHKNYPNPFNPVTTIQYELPVRSHVNLTVHDILGRKMAVLVDDDQGPGARKVQWNATGVPSGIYFVRMIAGDFRQVQKVMVLK